MLVPCDKLMLGGNIFGHFTNKDETQALLGLARDVGMRAVDTADVYSNGVSEQYIGEALVKERAHWFIATKAGLPSHASPHGLGRRANLFRKVEESLKRLKTDYIDLYQVHHFDEATPLEETLEALEEMKKKGWIRSAGVSNYSREQLGLLQGRPQQIEYHQAPFNITRAVEAEEILNTHEQSGCAILAYSVLARGLLDEKYLSGVVPVGSRASISENVRRDLTPSFSTKLSQAAELCDEYGCSLLSMALHWVCQFDRVRWAIVGVRHLEQMRSLYESAINPLSLEQLKSFEAIWKAPQEN